MKRVLLMVSTLTAGALSSVAAQQFERPFRITAYGVPITVDVGHAQALVVDFDRDGKRDLLVGQYGDGRLRIYRNFGTDSVPYFRIFEWLAAGDSVAKVAAG